MGHRPQSGRPCEDLCRQAMGLHLLALKGHPATGKSVLARALARTLCWPLMDKDDVKDHTVALPDGNRLAYRIMWQIAETQLRLGISVIAVSPLSHPGDYGIAKELAKRTGARLHIVETRLDEETWRRRLQGSPRETSDHRIRNWTAMQAQLQAYGDCWRYPIAPEHHTVVDTSQPVEHLVHHVIRVLQAN
jgi:predicted kinase